MKKNFLELISKSIANLIFTPSMFPKLEKCKFFKEELFHLVLKINVEIVSKNIRIYINQPLFYLTGLLLL